jgi:(p)ppGpp synthase/HD superfamily hydrolase
VPRRRALSASEALEYVTRVHARQYRKGTRIPYVSHLVAVAELTREYGGNLTHFVAALCHDAIEDQGVTARELARRFGARVAAIVLTCSDSTTKPKPPWQRRKERYLKRLATASRGALLVAACDKLHNAEAIASDLTSEGARVWKRFSAPPSSQLWYYRSALEIFQRRKRELAPRASGLLTRLRRAIAVMESHA